MPLGINENNDAFKTFTAFTDFARVEAKSKGGMNSIARVETGVNITTGELTGRFVTASTTDSIRGIFKWFRSSDDQTANDATRKIFHDAIADMFGGEDNIPESVRDAMKLADYGKGKPLTARRILAVKSAIDEVAASRTESPKTAANRTESTATAASKVDVQETEASRADRAMKEARSNARSIRANVPAERKTEVDRLVDMAMEKCAGDLDAMEVVASIIDRILLGMDAQLRSAEKVAKKVDGILANLNEMREAAQGKPAVWIACKDLMQLLGGTSLPPGQLSTLMRLVETADTSDVVRLKSGASGVEIDKAVGNLGRMANRLMTQSGVDKATEGADEKESIRDFIVNLVVAKIPPGGAGDLLKALSTDTVEKLRSTYAQMNCEDFDTAGMSKGMVDFTILQGGLGLKFLTFMKNTAEATLGLERSYIDDYDGSFDANEFGAKEIYARAKTDARTMMEEKRDEQIAKSVNGGGPGAAEMRALFAKAIGPEPTITDLDDTILLKSSMKDVANQTIATECKKFMTGDGSDTAFARDVGRGMDVSLPGGKTLSGDFKTARDQIAEFVSGGAVSNYADLDDVGKGKAHIVMALLSHDTAQSSYDAHAVWLGGRKGGGPQYTAISDPATDKRQFNLSFDPNGYFCVVFTGEKQLQRLTVNVAKEKDQAPVFKTIDVNPGSTISTAFSLRISSDEFERLANLDYSTFDGTKAGGVASGRSQGPSGNVAAGSAPAFQFRRDSNQTDIFTSFTANFA